MACLIYTACEMILPTFLGQTRQPFDLPQIKPELQREYYQDAKGRTEKIIYNESSSITAK